MTITLREEHRSSADIVRSWTAAEILAATGIKGGLIVHLGCGNGKLTAALGTGHGFLVHGLDTDPGDIQSARRHIQSQGEGCRSAGLAACVRIVHPHPVAAGHRVEGQRLRDEVVRLIREECSLRENAAKLPEKKARIKTLTEESAIASAARAGERSQPKTG